MPKLLRGMCDKLNVTVRDHTSGMTPKTLPSQSIGTLQMCLPRQQKLAKEEVIVDCVKDGKGGKNLERKHIYMESEKGEERSLQKLKDTKRYERLQTSP